ncbi:MAG: hypothetical protein KBONHNOK_00442 [Candidatus Methanoperedenaceae archaeon GB50]|nr:MAG: hypothetical protein KBONHNOK_00442 [Candidatus Methanoperedenaceae archaeon GB50]
MRIHCEQSNVGNVFDRPIICPPIYSFLSIRRTLRSQASSSAAVIPAIPPPTTSTSSFKSLKVGSKDSRLSTRKTAPLTRPTAFRVASTGSSCTHEHCSRRLVISRSNGLTPAPSTIERNVSRCNRGEHAPITTRSILPASISSLILPCPALLHR